MTVWMALGLALGTIGWALVGLRLFQLRSCGIFLEPAGDPARNLVRPDPLISVVIPARNEARDLPRTLRSLAAQDHRNLEVIVVDDESDDDTADVARRNLPPPPKGRLIRGAPRPGPDWAGKTWALTQGVRQARGSWLLFVDADVELHPAAIRTAWQHAECRQLDCVTVLPSLECRTPIDRLILPLFVLLSGTLQSLHPRRGVARLSGAFILVRREVYDRLGGHEAVRGEIVEDLALGQRWSSQGVRIGLYATRSLLRTCMYDGPRELWHGVVRCAHPVLRESLARLFLALCAAGFGTWVPTLAVLYGMVRALRAFTWPAVVMSAWGLALMTLPIVLMSDVARTLRIRRVWLLGVPLASAVLSAAAVASAWQYQRRRGVSWKGRVYPMSPADDASVARLSTASATSFSDRRADVPMGYRRDA